MKEKGNLASKKTQIPRQQTSQPRPYKSLNTYKELSMEIIAYLWEKVVIHTILVKQPQELTKDTLLVRRWIEL